MCDFVDTGRQLQKESEELERMRGLLKPIVDRDPDGECPVLAVLSGYNERSQQLRSAWKTAQSTAADALDGISIGDGETLPMSQSLHCSILPTVSWAAFTSRVDKDFPTVRLNGLLATLRGLSADERQSWADVRPETAAFLAGNKLKAGSAAGFPEAIMMAAKKDNADLTRDGIAGIRKAWMGLSEKTRRDYSCCIQVNSAILTACRWAPAPQRTSSPSPDTVRTSGTNARRSAPSRISPITHPPPLGGYCQRTRGG